MKIAVFRVILGEYDFIINDPFLEKDIDYFLFTNNKKCKLKGYKRIYLKLNSDFSLKNRQFKILIPKEIRKYDLSVYIDGNIKICRSIKSLINQFLASKKYLGKL